MRRAISMFVVLGLWITLTAGTAAARVDVHIGVVAPPPPTIVYEREPEVVVVPNTSVYWVEGASDYDMYRYGGYWYVVRDGYWYRGSSYRGPFVAIPYDRVPRPIYVVPPEYHRHPFRRVGAPAHAHEYHGHEYHGGDRGHGHADDHGHGRGGGHGHDNGHHDNGRGHGHD